MTLDEKNCWNPTWIVVDNVACLGPWGNFLGLLQRGGPNENSGSLWVLK